MSAVSPDEFMGIGAAANAAPSVLSTDEFMGAPQAGANISPDMRMASMPTSGFVDAVTGAVSALPELASRGLRSVGLGEFAPPPGFYEREIKSGLTALGKPVANALGYDVAPQPAPETMGEKFLYGAGHGIGDAAAMALPAKAVELSAPEKSLTQEAAKALAAQPVSQAVSAGVGEGTSQATGNPVLGLATGLGTASALGTAGGKLAQFSASKSVPSIESLKNQAQAAYDAVDRAGVKIKPQSFRTAVDNIAATANEAGIDRTIHPKATAALGRLEEAKGSSPTLGDVDTLRRILKSAAASNEPDERRIANIMTDKLDHYVGNLKMNSVTAGNPLEASTALNKARDLWSRMRKAEMLQNAVTRADRQAASVGSGGNSDNALRQQIKSILNSPSKARGFSADERAAMEKIVRGSPVQNALRLVGKLSPKGNGIMAMSEILATAHDPRLAALPVVGHTAKILADRMTPNAVNNLSSTIRSGGVQPPTIANNFLGNQLSGLNATLLSKVLLNQSQPFAPFLKRDLAPQR